MTRALLIDIGNSRIKWRRDDLARPPPAPQEADPPAEAIAVSDVASLPSRWASDDAPVDAAWISDVAAPVAGAGVERALRTIWPAVRIERVRSAAVEGDLVNDYAQPARLGVDRWMAAIGAHAAWPSRSLLVCGFGTATTIDLVDVASQPEAHFAGGLILPGPEAMRTALLAGTARLPEGAGRVVDFANDTLDAIASGIVAAQLGAVSRALADARRRLADGPLTLLLTGGAGPSLARFVDDLGVPCRVVPDLVLHGLAVKARADRLAYDAHDPRIAANRAPG